ncbi:MAG: hypothetical protein J3K34DRAFT_213046 [Monoraphidium minutum]|nr:MAG: hypothetical protein J3K34DRAFT_213046 [Monoraphidium minutum]
MRARLPGSYRGAVQVLESMQADLMDLKEPTLALMERAFTDPLYGAPLRPAAAALVRRAAAGGAAAGGGGGGGGVDDAFGEGEEEGGGGGGGAGAWVAERVQVDGQSGLVHGLGEKLRVVMLRPLEWEDLAQMVHAIAAARQMRDTAFRQYIKWLERNGPFHTIIDACNVAKHRYNAEYASLLRPNTTHLPPPLERLMTSQPDGNLGDVLSMRATLEAENPGKRALIVIHKTTLDKAMAAAPPAVAAKISALNESKMLFVVPRGSNDDWYFLYAAFVARGDGLLVTNDQLKDHIWAMLRPKHVLKWRERHIARYHIPLTPGSRPAIHYPASFTACLQQLPASGAWVAPSAERAGEWLCLRPVLVSPPAGGGGGGSGGGSGGGGGGAGAAAGGGAGGAGGDVPGGGDAANGGGGGGGATGGSAYGSEGAEAAAGGGLLGGAVAANGGSGDGPAGGSADGSEGAGAAAGGSAPGGGDAADGGGGGGTTGGAAGGEGAEACGGAAAVDGSEFAAASGAAGTGNAGVCDAHAANGGNSGGSGGDECQEADGSGGGGGGDQEV